MIKLILTPEKKVDLEALHKNSKSHVCDRIKAVLLHSQDWSIPMIFPALRDHETSVIRPIDDVVNKNKLKPEKDSS